MTDQPDAFARLKADRRKLDALFGQAHESEFDMAALGRRLAARQQERHAESGPMAL